MTEYAACKEAAEIAHEKTAMLRRVMEAKDPLHPETRRLVQDFADALAEKLIKAQQKYGRKDDWRTDDWEAECRAELLRHIEKGDPLDVAAYCAFMWRRGWSTKAASTRPRDTSLNHPLTLETKMGMLEDDLTEISRMRLRDEKIVKLSAALQAMVDRWEPDCGGKDRVMWENACEALEFAST